MKPRRSTSAGGGGGIFPEVLRKRIRKLPTALGSPDWARGSGIGFWHFDVEQAVHFWDAELFRIFGIEPSEGPMAPVRWLDMVHPDDRAVQVAESQACWKGKDRSETTYRLIRRDGQVRLVRAFISVHRHDDGTPRRFFGFCQDITEQSALMEGLRLQVAAERKNRHRAEKVGRDSLEALHSLGHEIRNPLSLLGGLCHVLSLRLEAEGAAELTAYCRRIRAGVGRLNAILVDLLALCEQSKGSSRSGIVEFEAGAWIEEMREIVTPIAESWSIGMEWSVQLRQEANFRSHVALASHHVLKLLQAAISDCGESPGEIAVSVSLSAGGERMVWKTETRVRSGSGGQPGSRSRCGGGWLDKVRGLPGFGAKPNGVRAATKVRRLSDGTTLRSLTLASSPVHKVTAGNRPTKAKRGRKKS